MRSQGLMIVALAAMAGLAACGSQDDAPARAAGPLDTPAAEAPPPPPPPGGVGAIMRGAGPQTFVGRWAANVSWCPNTEGAERPIEITATHIRGYENVCTIATVDQSGQGYEVGLRCEAEGQTTLERRRLTASGQTLEMVYLDRGGRSVSLTKCTTLGDTARRAPSLKID